MMNTVPRFWEVMQRRIAGALAREGAPKRWLFAQAVRTGRLRAAGQALNPWDTVLDRLCESTVRAKVKTRFGRKLRCTLCAGAPLNPEVAGFFIGLGIQLHQAYGQTECAPGITLQTRAGLGADHAGVVMPHLEVRLADDGEILVRGPHVMTGYWNDPEATAKTVVDGWLHTGDIGTVDEHGHWRITDRKKDFIKTAGSEMVAPARVEQVLLGQDEIGQALVCGDGRPHLSALLVPNEELLMAWAHDSMDRDALRQKLQAAVNRSNSLLPANHRIRQFAVLTEAFSLANGLLTPTMKVRRKQALQTHAALIESLYR